MKLHHLALLLGTLLPCSCTVVAGAGIGYVISREVLPGTIHQAHLAVEIDQVWELSCESLEVLHDVGSQLVIDEEERMITTEVNGAQVVVAVKPHDAANTVVRITAEGPFSSDPDTGSLVMQNVIDRVQREAVVARPASARR